MATLVDFSLVNSTVNELLNYYELGTRSNAFYYLIMDLFYSMSEDEIDDSITDSAYLEMKKRDKGHDRGIDIITVNTEGKKTEINFFNFKYAKQYKNICNNFPSGELDKVISFFNSLMTHDEDGLANINKFLMQKVLEIWEIFNKENPIINLYLVSNHSVGVEQSELKRFQSTLSCYKIKVYEITLDNIVEKLCKKDKVIVDAKFRAIGNEYFGKSSGSLKSIICSINAIDLLRIVTDDEELRMDCDLNDYETLKHAKIQEDSFDDNVRIYQTQKNKINQNIKNTATSQNKSKFFFYNNGITLTCNKLDYDERTSPVVELQDIQIVNGSQTIHSLFEALVDDDTYLKNVTLLIRIYETKDPKIVSRIAEFTNSQTEVKSRDLRSIDELQIKLEKEFNSKGVYYERKRNQFKDMPKNLRIDSEKVGQVLMAYYNHEPLDAKNKKNSIFSNCYDDVFANDTNYEKIMIPYSLFMKIELEKDLWKRFDGDVNGENGHLAYSTYIILYLLNKLSNRDSIPNRLENIDDIFAKYSEAKSIIKDVVDQERESKGGNFNIYGFFKSKKVMSLIDIMLN